MHGRAKRGTLSFSVSAFFCPPVGKRKRRLGCLSESRKKWCMWLSVRPRAAPLSIMAWLIVVYGYVGLSFFEIEIRRHGRVIWCGLFIFSAWCVNRKKKKDRNKQKNNKLNNRIEICRFMRSVACTGYPVLANAKAPAIFSLMSKCRGNRQIKKEIHASFYQKHARKTGWPLSVKLIARMGDGQEQNAPTPAQ